MAAHEKTYDEGLRDGKLQSLEKTVSNHGERLDVHSRRLRHLERIAYILVGATTLIEFAPKLFAFFPDG